MRFLPWTNMRCHWLPSEVLWRTWAPLSNIASSPMDNVSRDTQFRLSADAILGLVDGISAIVAEQIEHDEVYLNAAPRVLPH